MKVFLKTNLTIIFLLFLGGINSSLYAQLIHPGGWHTQEDLTIIREKVTAAEEPWITGWNAAKDEGPDANYSDNPSTLITNNGSMHTAGFAAWILTMKWVASGDKAFSDAAIDVINAWVDTVRDFDVFAPTLTVSTGAGVMAQAAEILAHGFNGEAGWREEDIRAAQIWFKEVIYDQQTNTGIASSSNFGTSALGGNISMAIFMDDEEVYAYQRQAFISGYNLDDGCNSLTDYIPFATGQAFETGRDQAHVQGGIAHLTEAALSLWNQGDEYVYLENNRLLAGVEYHARYNLGFNDLPYNSNIPNRCNVSVPGLNSTEISSEERGIFSPVYYMSAKLFSKAGLDHPNTKAVLSHPGYSPEETNFAHPGLGTFTFVSTDENVTPPAQDGVLVHITKRNATGFAIDGGSGGTNGQNVRLSSASTSDEGQLWLEIDRGNGFYSYEKFGTNFSLDGNRGGAKQQSIYIWETSATNQNQQWQKVAVGDGGFKLIKRNATGFAINGGSGGVEGRDINMWSSASTNQNLQWYITPLATNIRIEAEDFDAMSGIQTENSTESGENVGFIENGDWLLFEDVNLSGVTNMDARVATRTGGGTIQVRAGSVNGTLIGTINVSNTGGFQNWKTESTAVNNTSGIQDVYLVFTGGNGYLFNINWIEFNTNASKNSEVVKSIEAIDLMVYPNPVNETTTILNAANSKITIYDIKGSVMASKLILSDKEIMDISVLNAGIYFMNVKKEETSSIIKIIKK